MKARLAKSKKWTAFPPEYVEQIKQVFTENFEKYLDGGKLVIEGRIYTGEILLRVGFLEKGRLAQNNFEASMDYSRQDQDAVDRIYDCIDATASMMAEYFESEGEAEFPRTWQAYPFQNREVYLQYSTENTELEAQADAILGEDDKKLFHDESDSEDALSRADETIETEEEHVHGPDCEHGHDDEAEGEDEAPPGPSMFGGGKKKPKKSDMH